MFSIIIKTFVDFVNISFDGSGARIYYAVDRFSKFLAVFPVEDSFLFHLVFVLFCFVFVQRNSNFPLFYVNVLRSQAGIFPLAVQ